MADQQQHSIIDQPATPAACAAEYRAPQQAAEQAGHARDQLGSATGAQPHTNR